MSTLFEIPLIAHYNMYHHFLFQSRIVIFHDFCLEAYTVIKTVFVESEKDSQLENEHVSSYRQHPQLKLVFISLAI